ncbi:hypothetical protein HY988_03865 [Candidatus Micrarchaeota archaeon]|nr:hypothetical protein [Candidatus Micrarchaeota archaeon]
MNRKTSLLLAASVCLFLGGCKESFRTQALAVELPRIDGGVKNDWRVRVLQKERENDLACKNTPNPRACIIERITKDAESTLPRPK